MNAELDNPHVEVMTVEKLLAGRCRRCSRAIRSQASLERGLGEHCWRFNRRAQRMIEEAIASEQPFDEAVQTVAAAIAGDAR